jgi:hypothetical protein
LDGVFPEQHRHRIVDMCGRNVSVRVHALQCFKQSLFECVDHNVLQIDTVGALCKACDANRRQLAVDRAAALNVAMLRT